MTTRTPTDPVSSVHSHLTLRSPPLKKTILTFGIISGVLSSVFMLSTVPFIDNLGHGNKGAIIGYTGMVLSFLLIFFGIRSYRDTNGDGQITFGKGFTIGIAITVISCLFYVVTWEIVYFNFLPHFLDNYNAQAIAKIKASGASAAQIQAQIDQQNHFMQLYQNPFFNAAMTFIEPFPVGLIMTLISAAILRKKSPAQPAASPATA
jgi:hypothetical protein